jgi:uncharacterized protein YegP (UPF0339 family)
MYPRWILIMVSLGCMAVGYAISLTRNVALADEDGATTRASATFEVYKDKADEFRWRLRTTNQQVIANSGQGYKEKRSCLAGIESVKHNAPVAEVKELAEE